MSAEGSVSGSFAGIPFPLVHLLLELLGLLLIHKRQACQAFLEFESMEKGSVLVILPGVVDLVIPNDSSASRRYIYHLEPVRVSHQIIGEHDGALQASIGPFRLVGVCDV